MAGGLMRKKLAYKASVYALLSAMTLGQTMTAYAAASAAAVQGNWKYENQEWKHYDLSGNMSTGWIR
jgi:glucan-binding YG repeat protein